MGTKHSTQDRGHRAEGTNQRTEGIEPRIEGRGQKWKIEGRVEWADDTWQRE
jgi:hypothetical protein